MGPSPQLQRPGVGSRGLDSGEQLDPLEPFQSPILGYREGFHRALRRADPHDGRRVFVELAPDTRSALRRYFAEVDQVATI